MSAMVPGIAIVKNAPVNKYIAIVIFLSFSLKKSHFREIAEF